MMKSIQAAFVLCILVALNDARKGEDHDCRRQRPSEPGTDLVKQICSNATNPFLCTRTARKCLFKLADQKTALCSCIGNVTGVSSIYETWVLNQRRGHDECAEDNEDHSHKHFVGRVGGFPDYLSRLNATLSASLVCCIGEFQGLYFANGTVNSSAWKQIASSISNATVLDAVNNAIDSCASSVTTCSPSNFLSCVVGGCYNSIKT